jgi:protein TonB
VATEPVSITSAKTAADAVVMHVQRSGRPIPLTVRYSAVRDAREFVMTMPGANTGLLFGSDSADGISIDHAVAEPGPKRAIGFFRVQLGGWPTITESDRQKMRDLLPAGGLLLVIRTLAQRPWQATLYAVNPLRPDTSDLQVAEFPFDEYLLRNGWLTELASPPPHPQPEPQWLRSRRAWPWVALAVLLPFGGAATYRWFPLPARMTTVVNDRAVAEADIPDTVPLSFKLTPTGNSLELSWDRTADAVRYAAAGTLSIRNGPVMRVIDLNPNQLREGRILYVPLSGVDVDVRLEVTMSSGRRVAESMQMVSFNTASPLSLPAMPAPARPPDRAARAAKPADEEPEPEPATLNRAVKPFRADALAQQARAGHPADVPLPDTPPVAVPQAADVNLGGIAAIPPAAPPPPANRPAPGGKIEEARLISGRTPEYPRQAREERVAGTVEIEVTINAAGRVTAARALKGDPRLRQPALDAVKQWIYRPTMLNGKPIESQRQIVLNFKP